MRVWLVLLLLIVACGKSLATISVDVTPSTQTATAGATVDYTLKVTSSDNSPKLVDSVWMSVTQPGWTYTFDPDIAGQIISGYGSIETTIHVSLPSTATAGSYSHEVSVMVKSFEVTETGSKQFETEVTTSIPEFATVAIPVAIALVAIYLMKREN